MGLLKWIKKKWARKPDVLYIPANYELTPEEKRELAALQGANERLSATLKMMKLKEKANRIRNETRRN